MGEETSGRIVCSYTTCMLENYWCTELEMINSYEGNDQEKR